MATVGAELLFKRLPVSTGALVFGETDVPDAHASLDATLPGLEFTAKLARLGANDRQLSMDVTLPGIEFVANIGRGAGMRFDLTLPGLEFIATLRKPFEAALDVTLPGIEFVGSMEYDINVHRPLGSSTRSQHQTADHVTVGYASQHQHGDALRPGMEARHQSGIPTSAGATEPTVSGIRMRASSSATHTGADPLRMVTSARHEDTIRLRASGTAEHAHAVPLRLVLTDSWQNMIRLRTSGTGTHAHAVPMRFGSRARHQGASRIRRSWTEQHQRAMRPPAGRYEPPVVVPDPCYLPSAALRFLERATTSAALVFSCERHGGPPTKSTVVVPVLLEYIVHNTLSLTRVSDGRDVPIKSASLTLDRDSWTWGFSAALPGSALALLEDDEPYVDLALHVNGRNYRVLSELPERDRSFGTSDLRISGRGRAAELDAPNSPVMSFRNSTERTAQQLMGDVLTDNGVPLPWTVDWQLEDWLVPAGAFSTPQATYIGALQLIVGAAGGYLQPHDTNKTIIALPHYAIAPWDWDSATPDFELPGAVVTREGIAWKRLPNYNRVFLAGQPGGGVLGDVKRAGTAGDIMAPQVSDPLFTAPAVIQQRGLAILGNTGRKAIVTLRMPVLDSTGIIKPGAMVKYVDDGITRRGVVRSVSAEMQFGQSWQNLGVETHVG